MMFAWRLYAIGTLSACLLMTAGCGSARRSWDEWMAKARQSDDRPASQLPSWGSTNEEVVVEEPDIEPETFFSAGRLHESHGRLGRAAEQYRKAITARPDHVEAYNRLGVVLDQLRRFREADKAFAQAIALAPDQAHLHNNAGFSFIMQRKWAEAEARLSRAVELCPEFARARVNLAMAMAQQDRFEEAMEQFRLAVPLEDAYFNMGLMYQSKRRPAEAASAYKTALHVNPHLLAARNRLGELPPEIVEAARVELIAEASPVTVEMAIAEQSEARERPETTPREENVETVEPVETHEQVTIETTFEEADAEAAEERDDEEADASITESEQPSMDEALGDEDTSAEVPVIDEEVWSLEDDATRVYWINGTAIDETPLESLMAADGQGPELVGPLPSYDYLASAYEGTDPTMPLDVEPSLEAERTEDPVEFGPPAVPDKLGMTIETDMPTQEWDFDQLWSLVVESATLVKQPFDRLLERDESVSRDASPHPPASPGSVSESERPSAPVGSQTR